MNRVYMAESSFSITGSVADKRLALDPGRVYALARAIAGNLGVAGVTGFAILTDKEREFADKVSAELKAAGGSGVVAVGASAPAIIHALGHAINERARRRCIIHAPNLRCPAPTIGKAAHVGRILRKLCSFAKPTASHWLAALAPGQSLCIPSTPRAFSLLEQRR